MIWATGTMWVVSVITATLIGQHRRATLMGFVCGVMFGPIGAIGMITVDEAGLPNRRVSGL